jgi:hypothetical protein
MLYSYSLALTGPAVRGYQMSERLILSESNFDSFRIKTYIWLRRLVAGLSARRPGFTLGSVHMEFLALGQVLLRVLSPVIIISPCLYILI